MSDEEELNPNVLAERFEASRPRLLAIALRLLGSRADAEDVVQEAWLRVERSDTTVIENLDAWLTTVVSSLCLDLLRSPRRTREHSWNVEPWTEDSTADSPDPADVVAEADQVGLALFIVFETLQPAERIALVLHDVFGRSFADIAEVVDRSPQAARQLASRARRRLREGSTTSVSDSRRARSLVDAWLVAVQDGDLQALLDMLDENAVLHADYGERTQIIVGSADIASQAVLMARLASHSTPVLIDGLPGIAATHHGRVASIMAFDIADGHIVSLHVLADARRLTKLGLEDR